MASVIYLSILVCVAGLVVGTTTTSSTPKSLSVQVGNNKAKKPSGSGKAVQKVYFTPAWKTFFSSKQLERQPKWFLTDDQPVDGTFQARRYERHWIAKSWESCRTGLEASRYGYFDLSMYFNGQNYQRKSYPHTYPVLIVANSRHVAKPTPKSSPAPPLKPTPAPCTRKYITQFYIPIPVTKWPWLATSKTVKSFKRGGMFYVREYKGNTTTDICEEEATQLKTDLAKNGRVALDNYFVCAQYAPSTGSDEPKLEVWMKKR